MPGTTKENTNISRARKQGYKGTDLAGAKKFLSNITKKHKFDKMPKAPNKNAPKRKGIPKKDMGNIYMREAEGMFKKGMSNLVKATKFYKKHSKKK